MRAKHVLERLQLNHKIKIVVRVSHPSISLLVPELGI